MVEQSCVSCHPSAANGILKILEEPPERTLFLLVTHDAERLLTTILSRTQAIQVPPFSDEAVVGLLQQGQGAADERRLRQAAHMAAGNVSEATALLQQTEADHHELFRTWMRQCFSWDFTALVQGADAYHRMGREAQKQLLLYSLTVFRESLMAHYDEAALCRLYGEDLAFVQKFSAVLTPEKVAQVSVFVNEAHFHIERNGHPKILFLDLSLRVARVLRAK